MTLREWFKRRKERREARRREKLERSMGDAPVPERGLENEAPERGNKNEAPELQPLGAQEVDVTAPDSRFTEEYGEFLKEQENLRDKGQRTNEES